MADAVAFSTLYNYFKHGQFGLECMSPVPVWLTGAWLHGIAYRHGWTETLPISSLLPCVCSILADAVFAYLVLTANGPLTLHLLAVCWYPWCSFSKQLTLLV